ncbi:MAG: tetratricopeptide repeat protein [Gemmatimonadetes bacterium]|nr:tetratricopeptide repeat protein [Gemmatimonadota bacterium]
MSDPFDRPETGSAPDPEQLPLGMFEGVPMLPVEIYGPDDEVVIVPVREPPVCGEWSYDDSELEEPKFVAKRIDGIAAPTSRATPIHPIRAQIDQRPTARQNPANGGGVSKGATKGTARVPAKAGTAGATAGITSGATAAPRGEPAPVSRSMRPTIEALRLAFEQTPGDTARALAYAGALEKKGDATVALTALDAAEAAGADLFALTCARASALGVKLRYDDAEKMIKLAAKLRPDAAEVHLQAGILACRRARYRDAIEPLRRGIALAPDNAVGQYFIAEALNQTDDLPGALAAYQRAAELEPDHWRALKGVGIVLDRLGRSSDAAEYYRRARDAQRAL